MNILCRLRERGVWEDLLPGVETQRVGSERGTRWCIPLG